MFSRHKAQNVGVLVRTEKHRIHPEGGAVDGVRPNGRPVIHATTARESIDRTRLTTEVSSSADYATSGSFP